MERLSVGKWADEVVVNGQVERRGWAGKAQRSRQEREVEKMREVEE